MSRTYKSAICDIRFVLFLLYKCNEFRPRWRHEVHVWNRTSQHHCKYGDKRTKPQTTGIPSNKQESNEDRDKLWWSTASSYNIQQYSLIITHQGLNTIFQFYLFRTSWLPNFTGPDKCSAGPQRNIYWTLHNDVFPVTLFYSFSWYMSHKSSKTFFIH